LHLLINLQFKGALLVAGPVGLPYTGEQHLGRTQRLSENQAGTRQQEGAKPWHCLVFHVDGVPNDYLRNIGLEAKNSNALALAMTIAAAIVQVQSIRPRRRPDTAWTCNSESGELPRGDRQPGWLRSQVPSEACYLIKKAIIAMVKKAIVVSKTLWPQRAIFPSIFFPVNFKN
jgi:hypothetical protein